MQKKKLHLIINYTLTKILDAKKYLNMIISLIITLYVFQQFYLKNSISCKLGKIMLKC